MSPQHNFGSVGEMMEKAGQAFTESGKVGKQFTEDGKVGKSCRFAALHCLPSCGLTVPFQGMHSTFMSVHLLLHACICCMWQLDTCMPDAEHI